MLLFKRQFNPSYKFNVTFSVLKETYRNLSSIPQNHNINLKPNNIREKSLEMVINKYESKILFNSTIESRRIKLGYKRNNALMMKMMRHHEKLKDGLATMQPLPLILKNSTEKILQLREEESNQSEDKGEHVTHFPFGNSSMEQKVNECDEAQSDGNSEKSSPMNCNIIDHEIRQRYEMMNNWMTSYDNFEYDLESHDQNEDNVYENDNWKVNYGTADPNSSISNVPCGGCGALLHCKDTAIPGYIPSEIFKNTGKDGSANLQAIVCQRCYFLKEYNLALQVRVSPDDYPKILTTIKNNRAVAVLIVDLTDFPCSIWPGVADILGSSIPIVVVGNKIDLLPSDGKNFFNRIKENLLQHVKLSGFGTSKIVNVSLISAKTGFGIEELVTTLQSLWKYKGDVYLVGCTNVGKSSLFNALLQSDYCKIQATDLIQRATTSRWPGTTLNLLKFPIMRPTGYRMYLRQQRLQVAQQVYAQEKRLKKEQLKMNNNVQHATLIGHIGQTCSNLKDEENETKDCFSTQGTRNASGKLKMGINENDPEYALSRWCFDTPGVVQPDQILHLLTTEELVMTLPKHLIKPETFCVKPGTTLFIAGIARLDYLEGPGSIRLTVFRSNELPITVCSLEDAQEIYDECIETELFKVPMNKGNRLEKWPGLQSSNPFLITGTDWNSSCNDVVLSSAGWVAINCTPEKVHKFQAWTPEKRGIYIRDCILPKAVNLRGPRIRYSVAYRDHRLI